MNKLFKILLLMIMITASRQVSAQVVTAGEVKTEIQRVILENTKTIINEDIEINILGLRFSDLTLPDGNVTYKQVIKPNEKFFPRTIKQINICVDGRIFKVLNVPVEINVYKEVLVASAPINREQQLTKDVTALKRINIADKLEFYLTSAILNKDATAKKMFREGEFIDKRFVKVKPDVVLNSEVRVFFVSNDAVMIAIEATALSDGLVGDYIKVSNKKYNKVYTGKIIGENRVMVQI